MDLISEGKEVKRGKKRSSDREHETKKEMRDSS
jgi:hypothetical protein